MLSKWVNVSVHQCGRSLAIVHIVVALVLMVHPFFRIVEGEVGGFGEFLSSVGLPLGVAVAWLITLGTFLGSVAMIAERLVVPGCIAHLIVLIVGIPMEHARHGWFVVGGGRNGMEYSVTLIACLVAILLAYWPRKEI
jgi:putative oxidoreductase